VVLQRTSRDHDNLSNSDVSGAEEILESEVPFGTGKSGFDFSNGCAKDEDTTEYPSFGVHPEIWYAKSVNSLTPTL
jgi:hypothetical protein